MDKATCQVCKGSLALMSFAAIQCLTFNPGRQQLQLDKDKLVFIQNKYNFPFHALEWPYCCGSGAWQVPYLEENRMFFLH